MVGALECGSLQFDRLTALSLIEGLPLYETNKAQASLRIPKR